jgi:hypothetical protein
MNQVLEEVVAGYGVVRCMDGGSVSLAGGIACFNHEC